MAFIPFENVEKVIRSDERNFKVVAVSRNNIPSVPGELGGCASRYSIASSTLSEDLEGTGAQIEI